MVVRISHHLKPFPQQILIRISNNLDALCLFLKHGRHMNVRIPNYPNKSSNRNTLEGQIGQVNFTKKSLQNICVLLSKVVRDALRPERKRRRGQLLEYLCRNNLVQKRKAAEKRRCFFINFRRPQRNARNPFWRGGGDYIYKE